MNHLWRVTLTLILTWICVSTVRGNDECLPGGSCPEVYLIRGVVGYWPHVSDMAERMAIRGYSPRVHCSLDVPRLTAEVVAQQGGRGPINVIGYSYGASAAVRMARDLMEYGIFVDRMFLIECYDHPEIPPNVRYCVNIYESRHLDRLTPFRGTPARVVDASSTVLIDIDISCAPEWEHVRKNNHFTMADDPDVQKFAAQQFPSLALPASSQMPAVESESVFQQPPPAPSVVQQLTHTPGVVASGPEVMSSAHVDHKSNYRAQQPESSHNSRSNPYMSYRATVLR